MGWRHDDRGDWPFALHHIQFSNQLQEILVALARFSLQALGDDRAHRSGNFRINVRCRYGGLLGALQQAGGRAGGLKRHFAREQLIEDEADGVQIGPRVEVLGLGLLRRHVFHGAQHGPGLGHALAA